MCEKVEKPTLYKGFPWAIPCLKAYQFLHHILSWQSYFIQHAYYRYFEAANTAIKESPKATLFPKFQWEESKNENTLQIQQLQSGNSV